MHPRNNRTSTYNPAPYLRQAMGGTLLGITATYCLFYASELLTLSHTPDLQLLGALLLLGVPVLGIGWYDHQRDSQ